MSLHADTVEDDVAISHLIVSFLHIDKEPAGYSPYRGLTGFPSARESNRGPSPCDVSAYDASACDTSGCDYQYM